jgi:hypothetical protein
MVVFVPIFQPVTGGENQTDCSHDIGQPNQWVFNAKHDIKGLKCDCDVKVQKK